MPAGSITSTDTAISAFVRDLAAKLVTVRNPQGILAAVIEGGRILTGASFGAFLTSPGAEPHPGLPSSVLEGLHDRHAEALAGFTRSPLFRRFLSSEAPVRITDRVAGAAATGFLPARDLIGTAVRLPTGESLGALFFGKPDPDSFTTEADAGVATLASLAALALDAALARAALAGELDHLRDLETKAQRFSAIVRSSNDAIISKDLNSVITSWNEGAQRIFGYSAAEMIGKSITLLIPQNHVDEEPDILNRIRRGETLNHYETVRRRKDGTLIRISLTVSPIKDDKGNIIGASKIARDITEVKSTEEQLRQAQKMEAVGKLAGGIAHDFNNLLTSILGFVDMALTEADPESAVAEYLEEVRKSGHRAANLTQQLLAYSRKQMLAPKVIDLNGCVADVEKMLRRLIGEDILFQTRLDPDLGRVKADPSQIQQIIVNLALNARDAMPQGGTFSLRTENVRLDREHVSNHPEATQGPHVMVSVADTGTGMNAETKARIFEPFFTTKDVGKGTGLGLSSVYGIIKQSGGSITVDSRPGKGTEFRIFFPIVEAEAAAPGGGDRKSASPGMPMRGETILLAEDEASVRRFFVTILKRQGYQVLEAKDGAEALMIGKETGHLDLLLTDMIMPNMNGGVLAAKLKEIHPEVPVLYVSGYTRDITAFEGTEGPLTAYLQKPFTPQELLAKVRNTIVAGKSAAVRA